MIRPDISVHSFRDSKGEIKGVITMPAARSYFNRFFGGAGRLVRCRKLHSLKAVAEDWAEALYGECGSGVHAETGRKRGEFRGRVP